VTADPVWGQTDHRIGRALPGSASFTMAWASCHEDLYQEVSDAAVDLANDRLYLLVRQPSAVIVCDLDGTMISRWGNDLLSVRPHGITLGFDGKLYIADDFASCVYVTEPDGQVLLTIGTPGSASDTGADWSLKPFDRMRSIRRQGGEPFNHPTKCALLPDGDIIVADGYGNCKVHRFSPEGELRYSWGQSGTEQGAFNLPHAVAVGKDNRIFVADRENDRVQVFSAEGECLDVWPDFHRPAAIVFSTSGDVFVSELECVPGHRSHVNGEVREELLPRLTVCTSEGDVIERIEGDGNPADYGAFIAPHGMAIDDDGSIYIAEIPYTGFQQRRLYDNGFVAPKSGVPTLRKFVRS
jgi:hypothetical protein